MATKREQEFAHRLAQLRHAAELSAEKDEALAAMMRAHRKAWSAKLLAEEEIEVLRRKAAALDAIMDAEYDSDYGTTVARAINTDAPINAADFLDLFVTTVVETNPVEDLYK